MKSKKSISIINQALKRKKEKNSQYSLAWLARDLNVSRVFISRVMSGKKKLPLDQVDTLVDALEMDDLSSEVLLKAIVDEILDEAGSQSPKLRRHLKNDRKIQSFSIFEKYKELPIKKITQLNPWYNVAILDLLATADFHLDFVWMGKRLGIHPAAIKRSWTYLLENGLIEEADGQWKKTAPDIRYPTINSHKQIRDYHKALISKGLQVMETQTSDFDFQNRIISGVTFSANISEIGKTKLFLQEAQYSAANMLAEGECQEVYHLALMLFPLTTK